MGRRVTLQNRATPFGAIEAVPARGAWLSNRGCAAFGYSVGYAIASVMFHGYAAWRAHHQPSAKALIWCTLAA